MTSSSSFFFAEFTPLAIKYGAVNLGQGFPDFEVPQFLKESAIVAIQQNLNQYTRSQGLQEKEKKDLHFR